MAVVERSVSLWCLDTGVLLGTGERCQGARQIAFTPDGRWALAGDK
jgi:hypothetical protein